jgi:hypothetical protein
VDAAALTMSKGSSRKNRLAPEWPEGRKSRTPNVFECVCRLLVVALFELGSLFLSFQSRARAAAWHLPPQTS